MIKQTIKSFLVAFMTVAALLFLPAGTFLYWQAWAFLVLFFVPMALIAIYLFTQSPELLKRRLNTKEKKPRQSIIAKLFYICVGFILLASGLDKRYGWSTVPDSIIFISDLFFLFGYLLLFLVFKENKYLAHTIVVEKDQEVVSTGPYALVRHPMYFSELIMFIFAPIALGSYWAVCLNIPLIALFVARIITEEKILLEELKGYREYTRKTKYCLVPGIW